MSAITMYPCPLTSPRCMRWIAGTVGLAALVTAVAIAVWPASAADKARADGENLGQAVGALYNAHEHGRGRCRAQPTCSSALTDTRNHAGDELPSQVDDQADALEPRRRRVRRQPHEQRLVGSGPLPVRARLRRRRPRATTPTTSRTSVPEVTGRRTPRASRTACPSH